MDARSKYDKVAAKTIRNVKIPYNITVDVVEAGDLIELRVYENEIMRLNLTEREEVTRQLLLRRDIIRSFGLRCELGGAVGDPPRRQR